MEMQLVTIELIFCLFLRHKNHYRHRVAEYPPNGASLTLTQEDFLYHCSTKIVIFIFFFSSSHHNI